MKKLTYIILTLILMFTLSIPALAASRTELETNIKSCQYTKDLCHEMAECARKLGYSDDHVIIQIAKQRWAEVDRQQQEFQRQLNAINVYPYAPSTIWSGDKLSKENKNIQGPSGVETYYNYDMTPVVGILRGMNFDPASYPCWIRSDGCKMFGPYLMIAANFDHYPRGSIIETTLGWGIVCDTAGNIDYNSLKIATNW